MSTEAGYNYMKAQILFSMTFVAAEKNPISYKIGANITNFPLQNFAFTAELTRTNIITYKHSIEALTWENNSIGLGHYLGDNAMDIYLAVKYMPIRGLDLKLSYTGIYKYNDYNFVREHTKNIISQKRNAHPVPRSRPAPHLVQNHQAAVGDVA